MDTQRPVDPATFEWSFPPTFNFGRDVLDGWAARSPERTALVWCNEAGEERRYSFAAMRELSDRCASALRDLGVRKGDRVLVMLPRIPQWQVAMVGCVKLGAVPVPCIEMLTAKDVKYRLEHSGAVAAITTADNVPKFAGFDALRARLSVGSAPGWQDFDAALASSSARFDADDTALDDPAIIYYTSGSTGMPKGVTHASRGLYTWRLSSIHWQSLTSEDVMWCTADTGWSKAGTSILWGPWSCGSTVLFYNGPFDPARRLSLIRDYGVTVFCGAATEFRHIVNEPFSGRDFPTLRLALSAGESLNPEVLRKWEEKSGVPLLEAYGQTETLMTVVNAPGQAVKPGSMGRALPGTTFDVLDEECLPVANGRVGQLALRLPNPQMMLGFWGEPERTAAAFIEKDGTRWFLTGDMVLRDDEGYFFYDGRADDIIGSAGYRIGPMEVENALMEHPAVLECAVVGSPDEERGEIVKAFIALRAPYTPGEELVRELQDHVKRSTAPYKYPRAIAFVDQLPKSTAGKLLRRVLRDQEYRAKKA